MHSSIIHNKFNIEASNHIYYNSFIQRYMHSSTIQKKQRKG